MGPQALEAPSQHDLVDRPPRHLAARLGAGQQDIGIDQQVRHLLHLVQLVLVAWSYAVNAGETGHAGLDQPWKWGARMLLLDRQGKAKERIGGMPNARAASFHSSRSRVNSSGVVPRT